MPRAPAPTGDGASGGRRSACALVLVVLGLVASGARAELLGTHPHRDGTVQLMTDLCREENPSAGQRARQRVGGRENLGCWGVDRAGNPVVTWSDGSELELNGNKVRLSRRRPHCWRNVPMNPHRASPAKASTRAARRARTSRGRAHRSHHAQRYPPARLCAPACARTLVFRTSAGLHRREMAERAWLASLWRPYRSTLSRAAEAWHKSDTFGGSRRAVRTRPASSGSRRPDAPLSRGLPAGG